MSTSPETREVPAGEVLRVRRDRAGVEDGPLLRQVLALGEPGRVVAGLACLLLCLAPEHAPTLDSVSARALQTASRPRSYVGVTGPDAASYLQRMVSNDVEALGPGEACQALLLTAKARLIAPLTVLRRGADDFLLLTEPDARRPRRRGSCSGSGSPRSARSSRRRTPRRSCSASRPQGSIPTPDYGIPAYELLDADPAPGGRARRRRARAAPDPRRARPPGAASSTTACSPPRRASRSARSASRRGAIPARSRWHGCTTAATRIAACASSSSRETTFPRTTRSSRSTARSSGGSRAPSPTASRVLALAYVRREVPDDAVLLHGSTLGDTATLSLPAPVAQGIERCPAEAEVARSNRAGRTERGGAHGSPASPLLRHSARISLSEPPGRQPASGDEPMCRAEDAACPRNPFLVNPVRGLARSLPSLT